MPEDAATQGLEELIAAAALDDEVAAAVSVKDLAALRTLGVELSDTEQRIFLATDVGLLQRLSDQIRNRVTTASRRAFLAGAATAGGVLAASGLGGCSKHEPTATAGVRVERAPKKEPPPGDDARAPLAAPPRPGPRRRKLPAETGVRPDRPNRKRPPKHPRRK